MMFRYTTNSFGDLKNKRAIRMFSDTSIECHIRDLIGTYGYKSFDDFSEMDKQELASLFIELDDDFCSITECLNADQNLNLFKIALNSNSPTANQKLIEALKVNAVNYYEDKMRKAFDEVYEEFHSNFITVKKHKDNNESYWIGV